jgi:hypothetical protein
VFRPFCYYVFPSEDWCLSLVPFIISLRHILKVAIKKDIWLTSWKYMRPENHIYFTCSCKNKWQWYTFSNGKGWFASLCKLKHFLVFIYCENKLLDKEEMFVCHLVFSNQVYKWALSKILQEKFILNLNLYLHLWYNWCPAREQIIQCVTKYATENTSNSWSSLVLLVIYWIRNSLILFNAGVY